MARKKLPPGEKKQLIQVMVKAKKAKIATTEIKKIAEKHNK